MSIYTDDSPSADAFGRYRVSEPVTIFDSKQLYDTGSIFWSTQLIGNVTASYTQSAASTLLVTTGSNSAIIRQSKRWMNYQPGKSQQIFMTVNFGVSAPGTVKRAGYFSTNDGIFFTQTGSSFGCVLRSSSGGAGPVDTFISQSSWNLDTMDGHGPSGKILNQTSSQIYCYDFEWLGVGRVRYGIIQGGSITYVHKIDNINNLTNVYMSSPNQPIRYEIVNSGSSTSSMTHICSTVISEGGINDTGTIRSADMGANGFSVSNPAYSAMMAIQLKTSSLSCTVIPLQFTVVGTSGTANYKFSFLLNPSASIPWNWQSQYGSNVVFATSSATNTIQSEGVKIYSGYVAGSNQSVTLPLDYLTLVGSDVLGNPDTLVLAVQVLNSLSTVSTSLTWRESI